MLTIHRLDLSRSTNLDARGAPAGHVFVAERQTAGRGRLDHTWHATPGANLTFSVVLAAHPDPAVNATLPLVAGLAVAEALGPDFLVKWPNDVYFGERKLCGILCERDGDNVIVGIGVNVNETDFPSDLAERATSLQILRGAAQDKDAILSDILRTLEQLHADWLRAGLAPFLPRFAARDFLFNRDVAVVQTDLDSAPVTGRARGIRDDGALWVDDTPVYAGEVRWRCDS